MSVERDILADVSQRLSALDLPFMLTGSFALAFHATPRAPQYAPSGSST
jgi:hypothetical protein